jgi:hypothetical protein
MVHRVLGERKTRDDALYQHIPGRDKTYVYLNGRGVAFVEAPTNKPWRLRTASFLDPAGYTLTITSYLPKENVQKE